MTINPEQLLTEACEDCLAVVTATMGKGIGGPVRVVSVEHERTCPWLARVAPESATIVTAEGILMHFAASSRLRSVDL